MMKNILFILITLYSFSSHARWVNIDDASAEYKLNNTDIKINKNGTSEEIHEIKLKILNEQGRNNYASYILTYNESSTKLNIISAYTVYQNEKYYVDLSKVEDKTLASFSSGFDDTRQVIISFPKAEIGTELYIKYSITRIKTMLPNFYDNKILLGSGGCWNQGNVNINSKIPLYMEFNDPYNSLEIKQSKNNQSYNIKISLNKKICSEAVYNSEIGNINENKYTWVTLSGIENWNDYAKQVAVKYEKVINQPLPELFQPILTAAININNPVDQINFVTSSINEKIRYMGNWSSIDGAYFPRDLNIVANLQEADCKEFTSLTGNILKKLGYKVQPALVDRSSYELSIAKKFPAMWINHVFLKITDKGGKIYWVDPTNLVSMAQGIFPDISNKHVLILDSNAPNYEVSPIINSTISTIKITDIIEIRNNIVNHSGELILTGERALLFSGSGLYNSEDTIKDNVFYILSKAHLRAEDKKKLILPDLKSRIVKDLNFKFEYDINNQLSKTNIGKALNIIAEGISSITYYIPGQLSDIYIGPIRTIKKSMIIKNSKADKITNLNYELDSRWLYFKRNCKYIGNDIVVEDIVTIKESFIENKYLETEEYKKLKSNIEENINNIAIILH